jgi:hypothetical protein
MELFAAKENCQTTGLQSRDQSSNHQNIRRQNGGNIFTFDPNEIISLSKTAPSGNVEGLFLVT